MAITIVNRHNFHTFLPLLFGALGTALGVGPVFWAMSALLLSGGVLAARKRQ